MLSTGYTLITHQEHDVIIHEATQIKINVFGLEVDDYHPTPGELHIFGEDHGEWLAFETQGWNGENLDVISQAVVWYARYLDYPEMQIQTEAPRPTSKLRII